MVELLLRLIPALFRHFVAYGDLLSDETADAVRALRRQALGLAVVATAGVVAALMGCVWVIALTWDGPHRVQAIAALCIGFIVIAFAGALYAVGLSARGPLPFERLGAEWREDLRQLAALYPSLADIEPTVASAAPELHGD